MYRQHDETTRASATRLPALKKWTKEMLGRLSSKTSAQPTPELRSASPAPELKLPPYEYFPLDTGNREFRLLELLPLPDFDGSPPKPLRCRLRRASINSDEEYEAISYCWGDETPNRSIQVDDMTLQLPTNSEKALRRMASPHRVRTVYLDAVCINQIDFPERNSQVLLMGDIYRRSQGTLVYLGDADETTAQAFINLGALHLELEEEVNELGGIAETLVNRAYQTGTRRATCPVHTKIEWHALHQVFNSPWFTRVWVVQEIAVAPGSSLICGPEEIDMKVALNVARWLVVFHEGQFPMRHIGPLARATGMWLVCHLYGQDRLTLLDLLTLVTDLHSKVPQDKVFGMLGLRQRSRITELLSPDYEKPTGHVFRDAVRQCLAEKIQLLPLFQAIYHRSDADLNCSSMPSWVPHFDRQANTEEDTAAIRLHGLSGTWRSHGRLASMAVDDSEPNVLVVQAVRLCGVLDVSAKYESQWSERVYSRGKADHLEYSIPWLNEAIKLLLIDGTSVTMAARALVADTDHQSQKPSEQFCYGLWNALREYSERRNTGTNADKYLEAMFNACNNRRFAVMSDGKAGLVPNLTRPSDVIITLLGGKAPLVLRPSGGEYRLVGECYVDGWMPWQEHGDELERRMMSATKTFRIR